MPGTLHSVGASRRVVRSTNRLPTRCSIAARAHVTAGGERLSRLAAAAKLPLLVQV